MHRKTTSRRENKRLVQKHRRSAVKQALRGDHLHAPPSWHDYSWGRNELPLDMEPRAPRKRSRKQTPKKERCPVNRTHEWYKEEITETSRWWFDWAWEEPHWHVTTRIIAQRTCIHCWTVKQKVKDRKYHDEYP